MKFYKQRNKSLIACLRKKNEKNPTNQWRLIMIRIFFQEKIHFRKINNFKRTNQQIKKCSILLGEKFQFTCLPAAKFA